MNKKYHENNTILLLFPYAMTTTTKRLLCFDTETTGLPSSRGASIYDSKEWPYIIQLSFILVDVEIVSSTVVIKTVFNEIITIPDDCDLTPKSVEMHGITREMSKTKGVSIIAALCAFKKALTECDVAVGHNVAFDKKMLFVEAIRNKGFDPTDSAYVQLKFKSEFCTMEHGVNICKIEKISNNGTKYFKYPTLTELYMNLFNVFPKHTHNSMVDVILCLRCYCTMVYNIDLERTCRHFRLLLRSNC